MALGPRPVSSPWAPTLSYTGCGAQAPGRLPNRCSPSTSPNPPGKLSQPRPSPGVSGAQSPPMGRHPKATAMGVKAHLPASPIYAALSDLNQSCHHKTVM